MLAFAGFEACFYKVFGIVWSLRLHMRRVGLTTLRDFEFWLKGTGILGV